MSRTRKVLDTNKLATAVRTRRGSKSFRDAAEEAGLDHKLLHRTERESGRPSMDNLIALCDWLDVPIDFFIVEVKDHKNTDLATA